MNKEQKLSQPTEPAIAVDTVLAPVFPCKIKVDGNEYTSQEICQAFGFAHREFMFRVAIMQMKERHAEVSERYL
jgi:hypothetical protein